MKESGPHRGGVPTTLRVFGAAAVAWLFGGILLEVAEDTQGGWASGILEGERLASAGLLALVFAAAVGFGVWDGLAAVRGRPPPRGRWIAIGGGLVLWWVIRRHGNGTVWSFLSCDAGHHRAAWLVLAPAVLLPVHVAIHEAGHAVAGWLSGARLEGFRLGPILVRRIDGRLVPRWSPHGFAGLLGFHAASFGSGRPGIELAVRAAGGPAANAVAALGMWLGYRALPLTEMNAVALLRGFLFAGAAFGALLAVVNLLPLRTRSGFQSDGAVLGTALLARTPAGAALVRAIALSSQGIRPREWGISAEAFASAAEAMPRERDRLLVFATIVALDEGRWEAALGHAAAAAAPPARPLALQEAELQTAIVEALVRGDPAAARARLAKLPPHPMIRDYPLLAQAAVAAAEGDPSAGALAGRWRAALDATGLGKSLLVGNEWALDALAARLGSAATPSPGSAGARTA